MPRITQRFRRLAALPPSERRLLLTSAGLVAGIRVALATIPTRTLLRGVERIVRRYAPRGRRRLAADRIGRGVERVGRHIPAATCLTQALAGRVLLALHGYPSELRVGVARDPGGAVRAHAWVECEGRAVIGEPAAGAFRPFPDLRGVL
ncbi:MAG: lasso peptide biosynthesis B2 protein [Gemmatimonadetes bacterium]|nr:lasso peptide biosynthesis B2 protein [Gemmatimonadota bacterium]